MEQLKNRASLACQVCMNIRCGKEMTYQTLTQILKKEIPYNDQIHQRYILGFFEECYPKLMKNFMKEQSISRKDVIDLFNQVPNYGEKFKFRKALQNGDF